MASSSTKWRYLFPLVWLSEEVESVGASFLFALVACFFLGAIWRRRQECGGGKEKRKSFEKEEVEIQRFLEGRGKGFEKGVSAGEGRNEDFVSKLRFIMGYLT